ncbi:primosomal protein N', partial [Roseateles sp.]|uniref:replication restart helicase PriA n=1 Tax=Roseateles sp. TaxID=1971397 RepID=UPI003918AC98
MTQRLRVAVEAPQHSGLSAPLDYLSEGPIAPGSLVRVPLGRRELAGIVWPGPGEEGAAALDEAQLRPVLAVLDALPPLSKRWCELVEFAASYYQRSIGEVALSVLPPQLRELTPEQLQARLKKLDKKPKKPRAEASPDPAPRPEPPTLSPDQALVLDRLDELLLTPGDAAPPPVLLYGVTGSGKTEVYLRATEHALSQGRQVLVLVPEINLTPQLEARFAERFAGTPMVSLHSALTPAQRLGNWLHAHLGRARLVLGTRLAVFASLPELGLIAVDEEHDPSYKQQDGARYSARDLAVYRARLEKVPVILGSATPSLESWQHANTGRYLRLTLPGRIGGGALPRVRLFDMNSLPRRKGVSTALSPPLLAALRQRLEAGEQSLVFLNRRGYAPVLHCAECGWKSECPHCSAYRVFHKNDRSLRCHHCGFSQRVPAECPDCGNQDIAPLGRG